MTFAEGHPFFYPSPGILADNSHRPCWSMEALNVETLDKKNIAVGGNGTVGTHTHAVSTWSIAGASAKYLCRSAGSGGPIPILKPHSDHYCGVNFAGSLLLLAAQAHFLNDRSPVYFPWGLIGLTGFIKRICCPISTTIPPSTACQ